MSKITRAKVSDQGATRRSHVKSVTIIFALIVVAVVIAWRFREGVFSQPPEWKTYTRTAVLESIARGETVLVSITANQDPMFWRNELTALSSEEQFRFVRDNKVATFRADCTFPNQEIKDLLEQTGAEWGGMIVYSPYRSDNYFVLNGEITKSRLRQAIAHSRY